MFAADVKPAPGRTALISSWAPVRGTLAFRFESGLPIVTSLMDIYELSDSAESAGDVTPVTESPTQNTRAERISP